MTKNRRMAWGARLAVAFSVVFGMATLVFGGSVAHAQVKEDLNEADKHYERGNFKKAAEKYDNAIKKYPKQVSAEAYGKRASIFIIQATVQKKKGNRKEQRGILEAGLQWITQVAEANWPGAVPILEQKALILWELTSKPDAIRVAEGVVKGKPEIFTNQAIIGQFYFVREPEKSIAAYEAYLKYRPGSLEKSDVLPRVRLGFAYLSVARRSRVANNKRAKQSAVMARDQFEVLLQKHKKRRHAESNANTGLCTAYTFLGQYDRAITLCERIIEKRGIDRGGSVYFNLGQAYLKKRQPRKARTVGREFTRLRKSEAKGYILVGDAYAQEGDWAKALAAYQDAEKYAKSNAEYAADLGIKLGISYRRLNQPDRAIEKLAAAIEVAPENVQLVTELGNAYIAAKQDQKALATVGNLIKSKRFTRLRGPEKAKLYVIAGRAAYNTASASKRKKDPTEARKYFATAYKLNKKDVRARIGLVRTVNLQAYRAFANNKPKAAQTLLVVALKYRKQAPLTNQNLAVLAIQRGDCDGARKYLKPLEKARSYAPIYNRLMGRVYLCSKKPNRAKAVEHYAKAEALAKQDNLLRAEIYTEWAPLTWDKDLKGAIEKLESAAQYTAQHRTLGKAARRNLALALYRRGEVNMKKRRATAAASDFGKASRDPGLLRGTEAQVFEFAQALALLDSGNTGTASKLFARLASKGKQSKYLKAPYNTVGPRFFGAYAKYRSKGIAQKRAAAATLLKLLPRAKGKFGAKVRDVLGSAYSHMAYDAGRSGKAKTANKHMANASKYATSQASKRNIMHNKAVLRMGTKASKALLGTFRGMGGNPPEAFINLGIMLDRAGDSKGAYVAWTKAKSKRGKSKQLKDWINTKKRIFGY